MATLAVVSCTTDMEFERAKWRTADLILYSKPLTTCTACCKKLCNASDSMVDVTSASCREHAIIDCVYLRDT